MERVLVRKCQMDPGLVISKGTWSEVPNRCEGGASDGAFLGNFQFDPDSEMWKGFRLELPNGPLPCSGGAWRGNLVVEPSDFCHIRGNTLCECRHLTLKVDKKGI